MNRKQWEDLGLEKDVVDKIMEANNQDVEREKGKAAKIAEEKAALETTKDALQTQLDELQGKLTELPSAEDKAAMDEQIKKLSEQLEQDKKAHADELARLTRQAESKEFFGTLKTPFINDETREYYAAKLETALDDPKNRGKSRQEILDALTAGEDGKPRAGIYKEPEAPNKLKLPPAGDVPNEEAKEKKEVPHFW